MDNILNKGDYGEITVNNISNDANKDENSNL